MAITIFDLVMALLGPLALAAAAWLIAIKALAGPDQISKVVQALTRPNGQQDHAKHVAGFSPPRQIAHRQARRPTPALSPFRTLLAHGSKTAEGERRSDEKTNVARV